MRQMYCIFAFVLFVSTAINAFLTDKEGLILVPSVAFRDRSSTKSPADWNLYNQGWYYEENPIQSFLMEKSLELVVRQDLDSNRVKMFTAEGKDKKDLCIAGLSRPMCAKTDKDGRLKNAFTMTDQEVQAFRRSDDTHGKLLFETSVANKNIKGTGEIFLCDDDGVTFISDIDDTIKVTGVTSTTQTLINTFSGNFKAVDGMAEIYQYWQDQYNATFAYLTASPDQLYPFLREFFDRTGFPSGSAHMRHFTWLDVNFITFFMSSSYMAKKTETLEMFLQNTRNRRFVLLGDIFQKDPEIYANIYSQYPDRIAKIFIRKYVDDNEGQQRLEDLFKDIPSEKWATFEKGADLPRNVL
ncbi:unnamed protein product [Rotaria magnacalcarata]|uniref:Phosphatidate phosphatase APP1 catalytic domain-containing protein n=5 Tax=Rotaria magnacalcarata TaxID=392030 RepID=A0A816PES7_9BILA|nr:unnamed protein product [Rotaria magnacalcarata]CAF2105819.1 unnamed protein product [Rotaria magnacalcarata]